MDFVNVPLFAAATLVFISVLAGLMSARLGFSFLLVFLLAGVLAGVDGPGGYVFNDYRLVFWVGNVALAVILLDGGLRTTLATFRTGLKPAALLATLGVLVSAGITALASMVFLGLPWPAALLLGAIVGSTDAAAVFALLTRSGVTLNERVAATLEIESGVNDPMAIYLTLASIAVVFAVRDDLPVGADLLWQFVQQFGIGGVVGVLGGLAMAALLPRLAQRDAGGGILALMLCAAGLSVFAFTGAVGGSGFLAAYLFGLTVVNRATQQTLPTLPAMDGYAWLAQALMFLLLGLLVTPTDLLTNLLPSLGVALVLMLVARPAAVWLCLAPFRFSRNEKWFISWVGLRGAVPIVLALFPLLAGVEGANVLFNAAFVVVLVSLLVQGSTIGLAARRLDVALPDPEDEPRTRQAFGDFELDGSMPLAAVCQFYDLPPVPDTYASLGAWMASELKRPPVAGDRVALGSALLIVRRLDGNRITRVGLRLPD